MTSDAAAVGAFSASRWALRKPAAHDRGRSRLRTAGFVIAVLGLMLAGVAFVANIVLGGDVGDAARQGGLERGLAWSFGLNTLAFGVIKVGIAVVLAGILVRLWLRVDSVKTALPALRARPGAGTRMLPSGEIETPHGKATVSDVEPKPLFIHRMARTMWAPNLVMGGMLVAAGFVTSLAQAGQVTSDPALASDLGAWTQGLQFLGEGFLLAGIAFLLGTILGSLRSGGGEVQASLGLQVKTLRMPWTAKAFVGLMLLGLMVEVAQFIGYVVLTGVEDPQSVASIAAWLGPFREVGLGLILSGIVLALATIARALGFQFSRIREIVTQGV